MECGTRLVIEWAVEGRLQAIIISQSCTLWGFNCGSTRWWHLPTWPFFLFVRMFVCVCVRVCVCLSLTRSHFPAACSVIPLSCGHFQLSFTQPWSNSIQMGAGARPVSVMVTQSWSLRCNWKGLLIISSSLNTFLESLTCASSFDQFGYNSHVGAWIYKIVFLRSQRTTVSHPCKQKWSHCRCLFSHSLPPVFIQLQGCSPPPASKKSLVFVQKHLPRRDQKPHKPCVTLVATMHSLCMAVDLAGKWLVTALPIQCCMTLAAKCCFFFPPSCVLKNAVFQPELKLAV